MPKNGFDIIILAILFFFTFKGLRRGIIEEFGKLAAFFAGVIFAAKYYSAGAEWVGRWMEIQEDVAQVVGFIVVFLFVVLIIRIVAFILKKTFHIFMLGWLDRLIGMIFGFFKGAIILSVVFWVISVFPEIKMINSIQENSWSYRFVNNFKNNIIDTFNLHPALDELKTGIREFTIEKKGTPKVEDIPNPFKNE